MKKKKPEISIIVPVYNSENYLYKCINSIISQDFKNFELILINDGSTDNSGQICDKYAQQDSRIKVIHKKNNGQASARNIGLQISKGNYISFVDSDDWIDTKMYSELYKLIKIYDADISVCAIEMVKEEIVRNNIDEYNYNLSNIEALESLYATNNVLTDWGVCNKLYRSFLWKDLRFEEGIVYEDVMPNIKCLYNSRNVAYTNKSLYYYRQTENSTTRGVYNIKRLQEVYEKEKVLNFFKELKLKNLSYYAGNELLKLINQNYVCIIQSKDLYDYRHVLIKIVRKHTKFFLLNPKIKIKPKIYMYLKYRILS